MTSPYHNVYCTTWNLGAFPSLMPPVAAPRLLRSPFPPVPAPIVLPMIPPVFRPNVPPSLMPPVAALRPRPVPLMPPVLIPQLVVSRTPPVPARVVALMPPDALPTPPPVPPVPAPIRPLPIANGTCLGATVPKPVPATPPPLVIMAAGAKPMPAGATGAWASAGTEELPIKAVTAARINRNRICLSITLSDRASVGRVLSNRHPPDDGLIEAEIADFNGFWQCQYFDTGARVPKPVASSAGFSNSMRASGGLGLVILGLFARTLENRDDAFLQVSARDRRSGLR